ncbi:hypothetical protein BDV12DRAFT_205306 [Aspergillus spectabilis]
MTRPGSPIGNIEIHNIRPNLIDATRALHDMAVGRKDIIQAYTQSLTSVGIPEPDIA